MTATKRMDIITPVHENYEDKQQFKMDKTIAQTNYAHVAGPRHAQVRVVTTGLRYVCDAREILSE